MVDNELNTQNNNSIENASDSWQTILWKIGLAIVGAIILMTLFPHAFDNKITLTNELTGQKIVIPVETTKMNGGKEYCVKINALEGDEHTFCSTKSESLTHFVKHVKEREIQTKAEMQLKGQDISNETTKFYSLDKMIYEPFKQKYNIYEHNTKNDGDKNLYTNDNGVIGEEESKTFTYHGVDIIYNPQFSTEKEVRESAKQCYEDGNTSDEDLNHCVGIKLKWF